MKRRNGKNEKKARKKRKIDEWMQNRLTHMEAASNHTCLYPIHQLRRRERMWKDRRTRREEMY